MLLLHVPRADQTRAPAPPRRAVRLQGRRAARTHVAIVRASSCVCHDIHSIYTIYTVDKQAAKRFCHFFREMHDSKNQLAAFSRNARFFFEQRAFAAKRAISTFRFPRSEGWRSQNRKTRPPQRAAKACITRFFCHGKSSSVHFSVFLPPCAASAHPPTR